MTEETKPKKKRINSKAKGSGFEGHISKVLAEALPPMKFRRSQSSGAILGGVNEKFLEAYSDEAKSLFIGDVVPTNESDVVRDHGWKLRHTFECKFYKDCDNLDQLFGNTKILNWFDQAETDAKKIGKLPLLIFKFNRTETFFAINSKVDAVPKNISRCITLEYNHQNEPKEIKIFLMKEALNDTEWFKQWIKEIK